MPLARSIPTPYSQIPTDAEFHNIFGAIRRGKVGHAQRILRKKAPVFYESPERLRLARDILLHTVLWRNNRFLQYLFLELENQWLYGLFGVSLVYTCKHEGNLMMLAALLGTRYLDEKVHPNEDWEINEIVVLLRIRAVMYWESCLAKAQHAMPQHPVVASTVQTRPAPATAVLNTTQGHSVPMTTYAGIGPSPENFLLEDMMRIEMPFAKSDERDPPIYTTPLDLARELKLTCTTRTLQGLIDNLKGY